MDAPPDLHLLVAEISPVGNTSRRKNQDSLLVLLDAIGRRLGLGAARFGNRLVNGRHDCCMVFFSSS